MTRKPKPIPPELISDDPIIPEPPPPPRKVGRPKGLGKVLGSGRKPGTKNWTQPEIRDALLGKSNAIEVLADVVAGKPILCGTERTAGEVGAGAPVWRYPTMSARLKGVEILLAKCLPDLRAQEITGSEGRDLIPEMPQTFNLAILAAMAAVSSDAELAEVSQTAIAASNMSIENGDLAVCIGQTDTDKIVDIALAEAGLERDKPIIEIDATSTNHAPQAAEMAAEPVVNVGDIFPVGDGLQAEVRLASRDKDGNEIWELRRLDTGLIAGQWSTRESAERNALQIIAEGRI